jgi:predicted transposase YdaD
VIFTGLDDLELTERRRNFLASILRYIISNVDIDHKIIIEEITKISTKGGEIAMTTATRLIQQGIQEGMQQGMQRGIQEAKAEDIINLYSSGRFTIEEIAKFLKLNLKFVKEVVGSMQN